ncbi:MAG: hypothetical protein BWY04_00607 [candidate division CPR1 bacterium ADurb.Bin160]|jgi:hypothetical protein|uniref:Uncharacterized protein n=1 Tax=candidate division CPR1 bacterium ADurb.Bin160 TaxID=1852826 RepID=A0A1V5ZNL6_9BACT|nr:MAG: hypothetical protein BWY04_00607 [candidate division CPR1 bacterium ADurb.Bin160]
MISFFQVVNPQMAPPNAFHKVQVIISTCHLILKYSVTPLPVAQTTQAE